MRLVVAERRAAEALVDLRDVVVHNVKRA